MTATTEAGAAPTHPLRGGRRRLVPGGRLAVTALADQGLASASNFAVGVAVARVAGAPGLGVFSVAYAAWLFLSSMHRALVTDPMAIDGDARDEDWRRRVGYGLAADLLLGVVGTAVFLLLGLALLVAHQGAFGVAFTVMAPFLTFLLVQDYWRWIGFMRRRPSQALVNDVVFNCVQGGLLAVVFLAHLHTVAAVIASWGLGGVAGAAFGFAQYRLRPTRRGGWSLLRSRWSFSKWIAINQVVASALGQASVVLTGAILGLGGLGGFRAAQALVTGPIGVLIQASGSIGLPEASRAYAASGWPGLHRVCRLITVACLASVVAFVVVMLLWGSQLLSLVYGPSFAYLQEVAVLIGCSFLLVALGLGPILVLKTTRTTQHLVTVQVVGSGVLLASIAGLSVAYGIEGTAVATIIAAAATTLLLRWFQRRVVPGALPRVAARAPDAAVTGAAPENPPCERRLTIATILRPEGSTGVHTHVRELCDYLRRDGASPSLVTPYSWAAALSAPVFAVRLALVHLGGAARAAGVLWYYHWHEVFLREALRRHLAGAGDVVVYAQDPRAARAALRAREGPHQRVVLAVHFHTSQADEWVDKRVVRRGGRVFRAVRRVEREVIPQVDGIAYVSDMSRKALLEWLPEANAVRAAVIPNFIDPAGTARGERPLGDLVTVGGLERAKNHAYLLEVLVAAREMGRSYTLDVFGTGPQRRSLARACRALGIEDQVRFHGFRSDVRQYLPAFRVYVHASLRESQSIAIIEAQAAGLPVIAGDVGGVRSVCDQSCGARFWPLDDVARAAAILVGLLDDDDARGSAAAASRERFRHSFRSELVAPRLMSFLFGSGATATAASPPGPEHGAPAPLEGQASTSRPFSPPIQSGRASTP